MMASDAKRYRFGRHQRLRGRSAFDGVFAARMRKTVGPLSVLARPNALGHARFGIAIGRKVGTAARRNRIKRRLREAFRLSQHDWPRGYDVVCVVRPHEPATLAQYQRMLFSAIRSLHLRWQKRPAPDDDKQVGPSSFLPPGGGN